VRIPPARLEPLRTPIRPAASAEPLSAWRLAHAIPAHIFYPEDFDDELARRMRGVKWGDFAFYCPGDPTLMIVLNPAMPGTRQRATLMVELSHPLLQHKPCAIAINPSREFLERTYDRSQEDEAYDLGAAVLLRIQQDVTAKRTADEIAAEHSCSDDIVIYRIKRIRLWQRYERYAA
jgi:hypothetical protein